jgi:hypothetical protein
VGQAFFDGFVNVDLIFDDRPCQFYDPILIHCDNRIGQVLKKLSLVAHFRILPLLVGFVHYVCAPHWHTLFFIDLTQAAPSGRPGSALPDREEIDFLRAEMLLRVTVSRGMPQLAAVLRAFIAIPCETVPAKRMTTSAPSTFLRIPVESWL